MLRHTHVNPEYDDARAQQPQVQECSSSVHRTFAVERERALVDQERGIRTQAEGGAGCEFKRQRQFRKSLDLRSKYHNQAQVKLPKPASFSPRCEG